MERQSVVPGAAYLLALAGRYVDAEQILQTELEKSCSPIYFYSSLARVADLRGDREAQKRWLAKASSSVSGRATPRAVGGTRNQAYFEQARPSANVLNEPR